ncbi:hypothetical protein ITP53_18625 [Nonomuraea sp. K274]|uniref:Uncharacterized protein n=1 Tax=Nonomuraea cypriaca TaxID=1187855 RepID=A0A931A7J0_9ACTN|nr:hypothetical protein [Nonomuraea cypriaca]MBF8187711.1 hypothetical protein [Nonomuraea cypriaca]
MSWEVGDYHGHHVPAENDTPDLEWAPETPRGNRVRVRDYTCECKPIVYEFCQAGGVSFIRKITLIDGEVTVVEFSSRSDATVRAVWFQLCADAGHPPAGCPRCRDLSHRHPPDHLPRHHRAHVT